ncbi:MAG: hypothetical protein AB1345_02270 [Chloroflexota bacterium]
MRKIFPLLVLLLIPVFFFFPLLSHLEEQDPFCSVCHTLPGATYYYRAVQATTQTETYADLASAHYGKRPQDFQCIDCHRGHNSITDRVRTILLGATNTWKWLIGPLNLGTEAGRITVPYLIETACMKCHTDTLLVLGFDNHFHNLLPMAYSAWQDGENLHPPPDDITANLATLNPAVNTTLGCRQCHRAHHHLPGSEEQHFLDLEAVFSGCVQCHREGKQGPLQIEQ